MSTVSPSYDTFEIEDDTTANNNQPKKTFKLKDYLIQDSSSSTEYLIGMLEHAV